MEGLFFADKFSILALIQFSIKIFIISYSSGPLKCRRSEENYCFDLLNRNYKFYLAFENSNCLDYITEKFWLNALKY
jgi:hypothetical protein